MSVQVIVLGELGDLVKKICELELANRQPSMHNTVQMTAYYRLLNAWPVHDQPRTQILVHRMRLQVERFKMLEKNWQVEVQEAPVSLKEAEENFMPLWRAVSAAKSFLTVKKQLLDTYNELNKIGRAVGTSPFSLEVADDLEASTHTESSDV